ncbi:S9 family peptidase [Exilibacterium tricleocarpae]|uniref:S9 family peptidase n=1 Tax=Exilibacterium tricleocarpae TaxID=2591008 RepID=A0A545TLW0_9GAMM|nr:S9 family peptidase [Exilibacterium tricleocarpae]TQV78220.1 S9 family peptidase [Exilibacterium tricleocarpae]
MKKMIGVALWLLAHAAVADNNNNRFLQLEDIFNLEYAADMEITAKGDRVYFVRHFMDIQKDRKSGNIWSVDTATGELNPVTSGNQLDYAPVLSPQGDKLAYISTLSGSPQIHMRWLKTGASAQLTNLTAAPGSLSWSPDGRRLAFEMFVKGKPHTPVKLPGKPENAEWAQPAMVIEDTLYRADGAGFTQPGYTQLFVMSAEGGTPRQLTSGDYHHRGPFSWSPDGKSVYLSANRRENAEMEPLNSDIYRVDIGSGDITQLTDRNGPDDQPQVSPNGRLIAYTGFNDQLKNYENNTLYVMDIDGGNVRALSGHLDRGVDTIRWAANSKGLYFNYNDQGEAHVVYQPLKGKHKIVARNLGGKSLGRPYIGADFDVANNGTVAFTYSKPQRPADVAIARKGKTTQLTDLNADALNHKVLGRVEEIWYKSSADQMDIHGWIVYPPNFDPRQKYPLVLEIHGGPVAAYGPHFSAEVQLFAAAGYVVLYTNPRGSESYGRDFAHTIHHNYPSQDYDDLMSGVALMIAKGFIDEKQLFVTGGSGGGTLTSWMIGHTDLFAAAVVAKPVINWYSFVLTADAYPYFYKYWFGKKPWEAVEHYMSRSPISYVGNVTTPTLLMTGEADFRTPMSETEQYYQALRLQGVKSALVRIPDASHSIHKRPSNLMAKVAHILWWFEQHKPTPAPVARP